jgi:hypothetical protein
MDKELLRRQRISQALKGRVPKNLSSIQRLPRSKAWRDKIGEASRGRKHTKEAKVKCGLANKGRKLTDEHKKKISENNARYWQGRRREHMTGKDNWNFGKFGSEHPRYRKEKKTSLRKAIRNSEKYHRHKRSILVRDKFTCQMCGGKKDYLELDHYPVGFSELLDRHKITSIDEAMSCKELWDENNGRTLCQPCHEETDNFPMQLKGKRKNMGQLK